MLLVAETIQCDPNCHQDYGCLKHGDGKCDTYCVTGYGIDPDTHMCMSKPDFNTCFTLVNINMHSPPFLPFPSLLLEVGPLKSN